MPFNEPYDPGGFRDLPPSMKGYTLDQLRQLRDELVERYRAMATNLAGLLGVGHGYWDVAQRANELLVLGAKIELLEELLRSA